MSDVKAFVDAHLPAAQEVARKIGVDPMVILGQWGLETGWGKSVVPGTNNLGNIKGPGVTATDNALGTQDQYRAYQGPAQFGADFSQLIASRYPNAAGAGPDAHAYGQALQAGGYAQDPQYGKKIADAAATVRTAAGIDIDPGKVKWDAAPAGQAAPAQSAPPAAAQPAGQMVPGPSLSPPIDQSKVKWDATPPPGAQATPPGVAGAKPAAPAQGQATATKIGLSDLPGYVAEPLATAVTGTIGSLAGAATRLVASKVWDENGKDSPSSAYAKAKAEGDAVQNALTYQPRTDGGKAAIADVSDLAGRAKNALMSSPVGSAIQTVGKAYQNTFVNGSSNPMVATAMDMAPAVAANLLVGKAGGAALDLAKSASGGISSAAKTASTAVREAARESAIATGRISPAQAAPTPSAPASALAGVGAAAANLNPYPSLTGEVAARGGSSSFPQVKLSQIQADVPLDEQAVRSKIANEILGDHGQVREGVITGNEDTLRSEYVHAKSPENTPAQMVLRAQIAKEQEALSNYAQARIEATGANPNLINNEQRGQLINDAFHGEGGLTDYFEEAKQQIYDRAKAESGSNPIQTTHVDALLSDPQFLAEAKRNGHTGVVEGARDLIDLARQTGFKDPITGEVHAPGSVAAWDAVRKSNNAGWSPDNARTIRAINKAIDQDVASAAGSDAYKLGDAIHRTEKTIMDKKFMKKSFGGLDDNGVKAGTALEQLPAHLNNLPIDQWSHIHNTLDELSRGQVRGAPDGMPPVPDELKQAAAAARNEMAGALAREVYEQGAGKTGAWNQNSANKVLNSKIGQKILQTFPPDEVQRFHALNFGGQIMPGVHSYEGAAHQAARMSKPGIIEKLAPKAGAIAGGAVGGITVSPWAATGGLQAGKWLGEKVAGRSGAKRLEGESNELLKAMRANSRLGQQAGRNPLSGH